MARHFYKEMMCAYTIYIAMYWVAIISKLSKNRSGSWRNIAIATYPRSYIHPLYVSIVISSFPAAAPEFPFLRKTSWYALEMMSHGGYEVDLANMDCVTIIFHYALLHAVARRPSVDTHTARGYNWKYRVIVSSILATRIINYSYS